MKKVSLFALLSAAAITLSAQAQTLSKPTDAERKAGGRKVMQPATGALLAPVDLGPLPRKQ